MLQYREGKEDKSYVVFPWPLSAVVTSPALYSIAICNIAGAEPQMIMFQTSRDGNIRCRCTRVSVRERRVDLGREIEE